MGENIITHYRADDVALAPLTGEQLSAFKSWMDKLDEEHARIGAPYGDGTLWKTTGAECWLQYWRDDYGPKDALSEDLSHD